MAQQKKTKSVQLTPKFIHLKVDGETHGRIIQAANKERRSVTNMILVMVSEALEKREGAK